MSEKFVGKMQSTNGRQFHRSNDPTNSIKVLKEMLQKTKKTMKTTKYTHT